MALRPSLSGHYGPGSGSGSGYGVGRVGGGGVVVNPLSTGPGYGPGYGYGAHASRRHRPSLYHGGGTMGANQSQAQAQAQAQAQYLNSRSSLVDAIRYGLGFGYPAGGSGVGLGGGGGGGGGDSWRESMDFQPRWQPDPRTKLRLSEPDLSSHACRIHLLGSNHPLASRGGPWVLPLTLPTTLRPLIKRAAWREFAMDVNARCGYDLCGLECVTLWGLCVCAPPFSASWLARLRHQRAQVSDVDAR